MGKDSVVHCFLSTKRQSIHEFSYPSTYINNQFQRFFSKYLPTYVPSILPFIENAQQFSILREELLAHPSIQQILTTKRAANVDILIDSYANPQNDGSTTMQNTQAIVKETDSDKI
ncbi:unnamed protein product [Rotaria sp. Silwood2]|nr:unnamed protein product [Rotaria sp. Silwood2]CAF2936138.1 unnamed protein product [Rotaria sp. Silwood2]CAF3314297.1 unnamed protein product [Rotaria sp. Silwood2]CAF3903150.1 unnamed protein product [Rotaria sp. Silwood2]CAF3989864.1 unnamed protein product [Rotaria sp. Silwood2]